MMQWMMHNQVTIQVASKTFSKHLLDWRAKLFVQGTGCRQGALIQFGRPKSTFVFQALKYSLALLKLETNLFFKDLCRVSSLQLSGIFMLNRISNFRSLLWSESCIEYLECLTFKWVYADTLALLPLVKRQVFCVGDRLKVHAVQEFIVSGKGKIWKKFVVESSNI